MHAIPNANHGRVLLMIVASLFLLASPASAQFEALEGRLWVYGNGGYQVGEDTFRRTFTFRAYGEDARFEESHETKSGGLFDLGGSLLVWEQLRVGASYSQLSGSDSTRLTGSVPNPVAVNAARAIPPQDLSLAHEERATHVYAAWVVPITDKLDVAIFGGPSFFNLTQGVVTGVEINEVSGPPWPEVEVAGVTTGEFKKNSIGLHVGADVTYMITPTFGLGGFLRFAQGSIDMESAEGVQPLDVGGVQMGGGVRVRF